MRKTCVRWDNHWNRLLGKAQDCELAVKWNVSVQSVTRHRNALGILRCRSKKPVPCSTCGKMIVRYAAAGNMHCLSCRKAYLRQWREDKAEQIRASHAAWCAKNPERDAARKIAWKLAHIEQVRASNRLTARKARAATKAEIASLPCIDCGMQHTQERRQKILSRLLPMTVHEIREAWSCIWGAADEKGSSGEQRIYRDLRALGAVRMGGTWFLRQDAEVAA